MKKVRQGCFGGKGDVRLSLTPHRRSLARPVLLYGPDKGTEQGG